MIHVVDSAGQGSRSPSNLNAVLIGYKADRDGDCSVATVNHGSLSRLLHGSLGSPGEYFRKIV